jgi:hypothetical protein
MAVRTRKRKEGRRRIRRSASAGADAPRAAAGAAAPDAAAAAAPRAAAPGSNGAGNGAGGAAALHGSAAPVPAAAGGSTWRAALRTWPRKLAAAVAAAVVASGTSYFIGADFWRGVEKRVGTAAAPVEVTTVTDVDRFDSTVVHIPEFVVTRPIGQVPPPPNGASPDGRYSWAHELGGVDASASLMRVTITGKESAPVILQGLRVKVAERRPPLRGALLSYLGLGAAQSVRYVKVDLSVDPPSWEFIGPAGEPEEHFPLRVSASETEVFDVQAAPVRGEVSWFLELEYTADGEQGVVRIDDEGKPFRTTDTSRAGDGYGWSEAQGRWESRAP